MVLLGGKLAWVLLLFIPFIFYSAKRIGKRVRSTTRKGQDKLADVQNILHETITGNRIVKAFGMEAWEFARFRKAAHRLFRANLRSVAAAFPKDERIQNQYRTLEAKAGGSEGTAR